MTHKGANHMTRTIAYIEGCNSAYNAYTGGNPYRPDTQQHTEWEQGRADKQAALGLKPFVYFADAVAPHITLDNARAYAAQTDRWLWVVDNILDPLDIVATDARVNWVEDRFDELLAGA
jgi:hypothetical protein